MKDEKIIIKGKADIYIIKYIIYLITFISIFFAFLKYKDFVLYVISYIIIAALICWILKNTMGKSEIYVTNQRVYGKSVFGFRVDIPVDSITSVSLLSIIDLIRVSSSSSTIAFMFMPNSKEIHREINKLILNRTRKNKKDNSEKIITNADEIKKYKELLDDGAITKEEYEKKKKELLK